MLNFDSAPDRFLPNPHFIEVSHARLRLGSVPADARSTASGADRAPRHALCTGARLQTRFLRGDGTVPARLGGSTGRAGARRLQDLSPRSLVEDHSAALARPLAVSPRALLRPPPR